MIAACVQQHGIQQGQTEDTADELQMNLEEAKSVWNFDKLAEKKKVSRRRMIINLETKVFDRHINLNQQFGASEESELKLELKGSKPGQKSVLK